MMTINEITGAIIGSSIECIESWDQDCWNRLIGNVFATNLRFEECLSFVNGPCRWFTNVSGWIVDIAWTWLLRTRWLSS